MMGIAQKVARNFSEAVRSRGQSYFTKGRVSLMSAKPNEVVARVRGTTKYRVRARLRGARLLATCSCPYFGPLGEPCKHLWATLLLADSRGFLQSPQNMAVRLVAEPSRRAGAAAPAPGGPPAAAIDASDLLLGDRPRPAPAPYDGPAGPNPDYGRDVIIGAPKPPQGPSQRPTRGRNPKERNKA
ncbi:SWIM zinc finger family protein, partial [Paludisphaera sp.]|uniref:SWIM zinc finger family protein n=1 Tax=Paludisphaera sp. TaxID=2017432 RepID=UPI00301C5CD5